MFVFSYLPIRKVLVLPFAGEPAVRYDTSTKGGAKSRGGGRPGLGEPWIAEGCSRATGKGSEAESGNPSRDDACAAAIIGVGAGYRLWAANPRQRRCGRYGNQVDHIRPLDRGGDPWAAANLQSLCRGCHRKKTANENRRQLTPAESAWRELVKSI